MMLLTAHFVRSEVSSEPITGHLGGFGPINRLIDYLGNLPDLFLHFEEITGAV